MRIAQIAPLYESVPPKGYGGTERVVHYLTEELVRLGHDVTLFASGDSETRAQLVACSPSALRMNCDCTSHAARSSLQLERVMEAASGFDLLHFHIDYAHFPLAKRLGLPHLTTLHWRLDRPDLHAIHEEFAQMPVVSISDAQRRPLPWLNWLGTIHHGLPDDLFRFSPTPGGYLAFLGRMSPEKRPDRAIRIAQKAGWPLMIAAKVDPLETAYFESRIKPLLASANVTFLGEIGEPEKNSFLGSAAALIFPIDWPEPFGLAVIEAMACGTPVIAYRNGSMSELIEDGVTGFLVDTEEQAVAAVKQIALIDRRAVRTAFERRFSARRMAENYLALYSRHPQAVIL